MVYTRGLGTNLLPPAILMYLACRNEGIIHCPKDGSELLAKKKTFEVNIFKFFLKGEPISKFWDAANQNTVSLCSTICNVYASWKFFTCPTPHTPWKFLPFNPPPLPRNFHWPSLGGRIFIFVAPHELRVSQKVRPKTPSESQKLRPICLWISNSVSLETKQTFWFWWMGFLPFG